MKRYFYRDTKTGDVYEYDLYQVNSGLVGEDQKAMTDKEITCHLLPVVTPEQLIVAERNWRDSELKRADIEINKIEDGDNTSVGSLAEWRDYRKKLRALPQQETFPSISARPISPDI